MCLELELEGLPYNNPPVILTVYCYDIADTQLLWEVMV